MGSVRNTLILGAVKITGAGDKFTVTFSFTDDTALAVDVPALKPTAATTLAGWSLIASSQMARSMPRLIKLPTTVRATVSAIWRRERPVSGLDAFLGAGSGAGTAADTSGSLRRMGWPY